MPNITIEVDITAKELFTATAKKQKMTQKEFLTALLKNYKGLANTAEIEKQKADEKKRKSDEQVKKVTLTKEKLEKAKELRLANAKRERKLQTKLDELEEQAKKALKRSKG